MTVSPGAGNARTVNQAAAESAAARAQRPDPVKADPAAAPGAPATPTDVGAAQTTVAASTAAVTGADTTSPAHHTAHAAAARAMPGPVPVFDQIALNVPIKTIGSHKVPVLLHPEVEVTITIHVARSADEAARLARGEDITVQREDAEEDAAAAAAAAEAFFEPGANKDRETDADEGEEQADKAEKA